MEQDKFAVSCDFELGSFLLGMRRLVRNQNIPLNAISEQNYLPFLVDMDSVGESTIGRELKRNFTKLADPLRIISIASPLSNEALLSHARVRYTNEKPETRNEKPETA